MRLPSATGDGGPSGPASAPPDEEADLVHLEAVGRRVALALRTIALFGGAVAGADVLVVGASDGGEVAWCHGLGAATVVGIDHGEHFVGAAAVRARRERLLALAGARGSDLGLPVATSAAGVTGHDVTFLEDDLTDSRRPDASADLGLSWQTMEHVPDVPAAMRETARILRPGGLACHEDNPFFAIDGGHTAGTLDMPWGHVRLESEDLERFLRTRRPDEADHALDLLHRALNRATPADVRRAAEDAGLEVATWLPRTRTEDLLLLDPEILAQCRRAHPRVEVVDLVGRIVRCVRRRS